MPSPSNETDTQSDAHTAVDVVLAVLAVVAFLVAFNLASVVAVVGGFFVVALADVALTEPASTVLLVVLAGSAGVLVSLAYLWRRTDVPSLVRVPTLDDLRLVLRGYVASAIAFAGFVVVATLGQPGSAENVVTRPAVGDPAFAALLVVLSTFVVAPSEELVFRGVVQRIFRGVSGPFVAAAAAGVVFGFSHVFSLVGDPGAIFYVLLLLSVQGTIWGFAYERSGNLLVPVALHAAYNATLFGLAAAFG